MKLSILFLFFSFQIFASEPLTVKQQELEVSNIAKQIRKQLWKSRHINVESSYENLKVESLNEYLADDSFFEKLSNEESYKASKCMAGKYCEVFQITVSSSFHSGYQIDGHLVLLDTTTGEYEVLSHNIYGE